MARLEELELRRYGQKYLEKQDYLHALLALDAWTQTGAFDAIRSTQDQDVAQVLLLCQKFGIVINTIIRTPNFVDLPGMQHIFGVSNAFSQAGAVSTSRSQDIQLNRTVQPRSFVHRLAFVLVNRGDQPRDIDEPIDLPTNTVDDMIRRALLRRMNAVVDRVDELARKSRAFELCQQYLTNQQCGGLEDGSCSKGHVVDRYLTIERYNSQFRLHLLHISVLNHWTALYGSFDENARLTKQKYVD